MPTVNRRTTVLFAHAAWILWTVALAFTLLGLDIVFYVVVTLGSFAGLITWIGAIVLAARRQQIPWVVVIAFFNYLGAVLYLASEKKGAT